MKNKVFFKDDLKTMTIILLVISIVSIAAIGTYSGIIMIEALMDNTESRAISHLESSDYLTIEKTKNIQRFTDIINADNNLHKYIADGNNEEIQKIVKKAVMDFEDIEGCILIDDQGRKYVYNLPFITDDNILQMQVSCPRISEKEGQLKWYNISQTDMITSAFSNFVICGTNVYENTPVTLYIFVKKDIFSGLFSTTSENAVVSVLDDSGNLIVTNNNDKYMSIFYGKMRNIMRLYEEQRGLFTIDNDGEKYVGVHYHSAVNDFKFLEIYPRSSFYGESYKIISFMLVIIFAFLCILAAVYYLLSKRFIKPIKELSHVMSNFDDSYLDKHIEVIGNNEVSKLSAGFNRMIDRINLIIENIKQKEEAQKKAELMALRSQIKPHFIYNTLNSIKILAIYNKQPNIARSLQILARLIRNAFSSVETVNLMESEIEFIKDYIELIQMCYVNKLDVEIEVDKDAGKCMIPVMVLQPIVENAVNHGLAVKLAEGNEPAKLYIRAALEDEKLLVEVTDNGTGIDSDAIEKIFHDETESLGGGIGLKNIADRIKLLYGDDYGISIKSKEGFYTTIQLRLPFEQQEEEK